MEVKQLLYEWLHGYMWWYRFFSLERSLYEFQQPANDSAGSTVKPQQTVRYGRRSFKRNTARNGGRKGATQVEGGME